MTLENFTTYTAGGAQIAEVTVASGTLIQGRAQEPSEAWVYADKTAGHFGRTFEHDFILTPRGYDSTGCYRNWAWGVSNNVDSAQDHYSGTLQGLDVFVEATGYNIFLGNDETSEQSKLFNAAVLDTPYYLTVQRGLIATIAATTIRTKCRGMVESYLYLDRGAGQIGTTFTHTVEATLHWGNHNPSMGGIYQICCWAVANTLADATAWDAANSEALSLALYGANSKTAYTWRLRNEESGTHDVYTGADWDATYYHTLIRVNSPSTIAAEIYSDAARTVLVDTLSVAVADGRTYQYQFGLQTMGYGSYTSDSNGFADWTNANLDCGAGVEDYTTFTAAGADAGEDYLVAYYWTDADRTVKGYATGVKVSSARSHRYVYAFNACDYGGTTARGLDLDVEDLDLNEGGAPPGGPTYSVLNSAKVGQFAVLV